MDKNVQLQPEKIIDTISLLEKRIEDRFPNSGLKKVCHNFLQITLDSKQNIDWISKPNLSLRVFAYLVILIGLGGLIYSITYVDLEIKNTTLSNIVALSEAIFNDIVLIGAAIFFLITLESRLKTKRALKALNELRGIAHVIDMHQLTKDPNLTDLPESATENSPKRTFTRFELQRYLDYCSEAMALVGKVAALYSQSLPDENVVQAANEIEVLTTGLSRKIWQKLIILNESTPKNNKQT
ncbi:hypothetical protein J8L88_13235 [Aquimarina sp. MMG015]|uniref:hypothetical protein n=1 Tax=Aquimarina TaxID=290174 RepID=UPI0003F99CAE|nr:MULTISPECIES: hypothetical protein [Aquimarina]AXT56089.1 hypothetical protein D1815_10120 [Aquimarina sp. AD1]MBQ4803820.1 hypothetical protein [Aquimarina sp. MMG015]RKN13005.1 hypothetical protein D7035_18095 [Aquimarina sp. AD1]